MGKVWVNASVEVDVTQVNKTWFTLKKKKDYTPQFVVGFYQRFKVGDMCRIKKLPDNKPATIEKFIREGITPGATLYAEKGILPPELKKDYLIEELDAANGEHVRGEIHINNIKNAWKQLKKNIKQEYISVSPQHLQGYCNEVSWKINNWHLSPSDRFAKLLGAAATSGPLHYNELTARNRKKKSV